MEEKYLEYKKSKMYIKHKIINVFLIILFLSIVGLMFYFYLQYNGDKKVVNENKNYFYEIKDNVVYLNSSDGLEGTYKCIKDCDIYSTETMPGYFLKGKIMIKDGEIIYLYDLLNNKKLSSNYNNIEYIYDNLGTELNNVKMFKVTDTFDKKGIIDINGSVLVGSIYDELGKKDSESLINYSYEKNYITAKTGEKWGLIALTNGKGLIDFQYDDIKVSPYNKLAVKEGNLWILVDEVNKKLINKGYSSIDVYEKYLVVSESDKAFIVDVLGNVTSNKIDLFYDVDPWNEIKENGLITEEENGIIYLNVNTLINNKNKLIKYYYDEENNEIKESL
ncbi:MAG: hypothetical protein PHF21_04310 [Bacilli bacterium]|nr:hypothetical protein [Bacilli bacterium]